MASEAPSPRRGTPPRSATFLRLENRLRRQVGQAISDYSMIGAGDRILVAVSGGKDSYTLLTLLRQLQSRAPLDFEIRAVHLDQKQPGFPTGVIRRFLEEEAIPHDIITQDTYGVVARVIPEGRNRCGLCSRLRRGALYRWAREAGYNVLALGHHQDDILETFLLNLFHGGRLAAMPPKLLSDDGQIVVIRPLAYCAESDIARYARASHFPVVPCKVCGSQDRLERTILKQLLADWRRDHPERVASIGAALGRIVPSHLLDRDQWDFGRLRAPTLPTSGAGPATSR
jgi:tRNA 2-thiocytidine biosynthesis protein TtcA